MGAPRFAAATLVTALVSACSAHGNVTASDGAHRHPAPEGGSPTPREPDAAAPIPDGTEGTSILGCSPSCQAPQRCSMAAFTCLDPGKCLVDGDCADGQKCDASTGTCQVGGDCGEVQFG